MFGFEAIDVFSTRKHPELIHPESKQIQVNFQPEPPPTSRHERMKAAAHLPFRIRGTAARSRFRRVQKRIQSESTALGSHGQDLLHRVESHGRRLVGEAMTNSLDKREERGVAEGDQFECHSGSARVCFVRGMLNAEVHRPWSLFIFFYDH